MKKALLMLMTGILISLSSCKDDPTDFSFTHDYNEFTINIDPTTSEGELELGEVELETDVQSLVADNKVNVDNLKSVKIKSITLSIADTDSLPYTFNLLSRVSAQIGKTDATALIEVAGKNPVPSDGLSTLDLEVSDVELLDYFKKTKIRFNLKGFTNEPINHPFALKIKMEVQFKGEIL